MKSKNISDHWKEKALPAYSRIIFVKSFLLAFYLLLWLSVFVAVFVSTGALFSGKPLRDCLGMLYRLDMQVVILAAALGYAWIRKKLNAHFSRASKDYPLASRVLHRMALGSVIIKEVAFDIDCALSGSKKKTSNNVSRPVYVAGLARAGTTILLESLYKTGAFATLTYRDMPFVIAPSLWRRLSGRQHRVSQLKERAHGDRIYVNYDSPEAFEEVFWKTFAAEKYIRDAWLEPFFGVDKDLVEKYRCYVFNIISRDTGPSERCRYLAKNNNNLLRINTIKAAFPDSIIIVPFRHPADHARSLQRQHERFVERHRSDPFTLTYMNWLGHFEFGANVKPFKFSDSTMPPSMELLADPRYWIDYWKSVYEYIIEVHSAHVVFFDYNLFCRQPQLISERLESLLFLEHGAMGSAADLVQPARVYDVKASLDLPEDVETVYQKLQELSI